MQLAANTGLTHNSDLLNHVLPIREQSREALKCNILKFALTIKTKNFFCFKSLVNMKIIYLKMDACKNGHVLWKDAIINVFVI